MDSVKDALKESMSDLQVNFEERMANFEADLHKKTSSSTNLVNLAEEFTAFKTFVMQTLKSLQLQISVLAQEVDNIETRKRRKILLFYGVTEHKDEVTAQVISDSIRQRLKINSITSDDIDRCHRMGRQPSDNKPRPIQVKFQTITLRDSIGSAKAKLKGTGVTISEFLTRSRHAMFMAEREKFGVARCWTREGSIFVSAADGSRHRITSLEDLKKMKGIETDIASAKTMPTKQRRAAASKK